MGGGELFKNFEPIHRRFFFFDSSRFFFEAMCGSFLFFFAPVIITSTDDQCAFRNYYLRNYYLQAGYPVFWSHVHGPGHPDNKYF
jgi:hypothetical protein